MLPFLVLVSAPVAGEEPKQHVTSMIQVEVLDSGGLGASDITPRSLLPLALELIKVFEDWVPTAYDDASAYCTVGYGHLIAKKPCAEAAVELASYSLPMGKKAGIDQLELDSRAARLAVMSATKDVTLTDEQFGALTSFVFNVGATNFKNSTLLQYVLNEEFEGAAKQFGRWVKSKGKTLDGLIARRNCEAELFRGKLHLAADGTFHRESCENLGAAAPGETLIDIEMGEKR